MPKNQAEAVGRLLDLVTYFVRKQPYEATIPEDRQRWGSDRRPTPYRQAFCSRLPQNDTARRWAGKDADVLTCGPEVQRVRFIDYDVRQNHAVFQVAAETAATDQPIVVDLRDDTLLDLMQAAAQETDQNGDIWYRGPFCWGLRGSQLILVRVGSWLHQSMQQGARNQQQRPVSMKDLESWRIYRVGVKRDKMVIPVLDRYYVDGIVPGEDSATVRHLDYHSGHADVTLRFRRGPVFLNYSRDDHSSSSISIDRAYRSREVFDCGDGRVKPDSLTRGNTQRLTEDQAVSMALYLLRTRWLPTTPPSVAEARDHLLTFLPGAVPVGEDRLSLSAKAPFFGSPRAITVAITVRQAA